MRHASASLLAVLLACAAFGCATPRAEALADDSSHAPQPTPQRGAELYGRYCTGCHASAVRAASARSGAPWLMHIQARVAMGSTPSWPADSLASEDARQIVNYLDAAAASRLDD
jgi:mono/diheme cytochrome c family protein